jgi:putative hydrolase of the HAD superfamily
VPHAFRAVLFDVAGTLIELAEPVGVVYARVAARHGAMLEPALLGPGFRDALRTAPRRVFPGAPPRAVAVREREWWRDVVGRTFDQAGAAQDDFDFDACFTELYALYAGRATWQPRPGAHSALAELRATGLVTGVVSNFDHRLPDVLEALDFTELLDVVMYPQRCGAAKPDREIFHAALKLIEIPPHQAIHVGDDPDADVIAARHAGLTSLPTDPTGLAALPARIEAIATLDPPARNET